MVLLYLSIIPLLFVVLQAIHYYFLGVIVFLHAIWETSLLKSVHTFSEFSYDTGIKAKLFNSNAFLWLYSCNKINESYIEYDKYIK